jgi:hypothetical protein
MVKLLTDKQRAVDNAKKDNPWAKNVSRMLSQQLGQARMQGPTAKHMRWTQATFWHSSQHKGCAYQAVSDACLTGCVSVTLQGMVATLPWQGVILISRLKTWVIEGLLKPHSKRWPVLQSSWVRMPPRMVTMRGILTQLLCSTGHLLECGFTRCTCNACGRLLPRAAQAVAL